MKSATKNILVAVVFTIALVSLTSCTDQNEKLIEEQNVRERLRTEQENLQYIDPKDVKPPVHG